MAGFKEGVYYSSNLLINHEVGASVVLSMDKIRLELLFSSLTGI